MRRTVTLLFLGVFACSQKEKPKPSAPPVDIAKMAPAGVEAPAAQLVPKDAVFLLRISSQEKLEEIAERIAEDLLAVTRVEPMPVITGMAGVDPFAIERGHPIFLCANLGAAGAPPRFTIIAPVQDPDAVAEAHKAGASAVVGDYVAVSHLAEYEAGGSPLAAALMGGDISLRLDLARVVSNYRAEIGLGLSGLQGMVMAAAGRLGTASIDTSEMTARTTRWLRKLVDSAETLDAVVNHDEGRFDVQVALTAKEGSPLAEAEHPKSGLVHIGRHLPPDMPVTVLYRIDVAGVADLFLPMFTALMEKRPAEEREAMEGNVRRMNEAAQLLTDGWAMALDFGEGGMRAAMVVGARDAAAYLAIFRELLQTPALAQVGMGFSNEGSREVAGTNVERMRMTFDVQKYLEFLGLEGFPPEMLGLTSAALALMLGEDGLLFEMAARGDSVFVAVAPDKGLMDGMLQRDAPPAWLEGTAAAIGGELGFLVRLEMRGCMRGVSEMMAKLAPEMPVAAYPEGKDLPVLLYGTVDGRVYRGGLTAHLGELAAFFRADQDEKK
jgi:hypothetical protein